MIVVERKEIFEETNIQNLLQMDFSTSADLPDGDNSVSNNQNIDITLSSSAKKLKRTQSKSS